MKMMLDMTAVSINRELTTASAQTSGETNGKGAGSFQSLLARLAGQADGESRSGSMNSSIALMTSVIPFLSVHTDEGELISWLDQLLQQLEQMEPEALQLLLEENPDLAALVSYLTVTNAASELPLGDQLLQFRQQDSLANGEQLKGVIRDWIASIKSGDANSQTALGQAQSFRQLVQSLLPDSKLAEPSEGLTVQQGNALPSNLTAGTRIGSVHNGSMPNHADTEVPGEQRATDKGASQQNAIVQAANAVAKSNLLPKTDLLRPELLELTLGETAETQALENKSAESSTSQTQASLTQETLKAAADATNVRQPSTQTVQVPFERFAQNMERFVTKSFQITQQNGFAEAKISLVPEHLGQVDIKLSLQNGQLTAQIVTETAAGREALEQQLGALRTALQAQGIQVERLEITQQSTATNSFAFLKDQGQQQSARQFHQQTRSSSNGYEEDEIDFAQELELIDSEYETYYSGRAFHAMA